MLKEVLNQRGLSNREVEVTELVSQGFSNREIAGKLFITEKTVKFHLTNVYKKMQVRSRAQLIVWCVPHLSFEGSSRNESQANPKNRDRGILMKEEKGDSSLEEARDIPFGSSTLNDISSGE